MRVLGLDIGKRRIGVAVSDELGLLARPVETVQSVSLNVDVKRIAELAQELGAEMVVVGDPLHMSGDPSTMSNRARKFGETLQATSGLPVEYCDERLTSVEAERILRDQGVHPRKVREQIDAVAASVILQSYLNGKKPPRSPDAPLEDRYW
ncbi:MAG: Holliday junction resolvase RuvX [Chloroflexota bacterium]|nr:Holliday junction resolvase RuvX [Chloroflexota bacterium]